MKGKFQCCPSGDCDEKHVAIQVSSLNEFDASDKKVKGSASLKDSTWAVGEIENFMSGTPPVNTTKYPFSLIVEGGTLLLDTYTYDSATTLVYGDTSIDVPASAMKFDVRVTDWTFADMSNTLQVGISLESKGNKYGKSTLKKGPKHKGKVMEFPDGSKKTTKDTDTKAINFGEMYFYTPLSALYDGEPGEVVATSDTRGDHTEITFTFTSFEESLVYDPTVGDATDVDDTVVAELLEGFEEFDESASGLLVPGMVTSALCFLTSYLWM